MLVDRRLRISLPVACAFSKLIQLYIIVLDHSLGALGQENAEGKQFPVLVPEVLA